MLAAFVEFHLHQRITLVLVNDAYEVCFRHTVFELHAFAQCRNQLRTGLTEHFRQVGLGYLVFGVHQAIRQLAVVSQNQQTFGVCIQASDMEQPFASIKLADDQIADATPTHFVRHGRLHAAWLVQHVIGFILIHVDSGPVDVDDIARWVNLHALFRNGLAVDLHTPVTDQNFRVPT